MIEEYNHFSERLKLMIREGENRINCHMCTKTRAITCGDRCEYPGQVEESGKMNHKTSKKIQKSSKNACAM